MSKNDHISATDTVRLIAGVTRVTAAPSVIEGEASSTGKTISVRHQGRDYQLDAAKIAGGDVEVRDARTFELYTPERFRRRQRTNHGPGPQAGANQVSDADDLPPATHALPEGAE